MSTLERGATLGKDYSLADIARAGLSIGKREAEATYKLDDFLNDVQTIIKADQQALPTDQANAATEPLLQRLIPYAETVVYSKPAEQIWMNDVFAAAIAKRVGKGSEFQLISGKVDALLGTALEIDRRGLFNPEQKRNVRVTLGLPQLSSAPAPRLAPVR